MKRIFCFLLSVLLILGTFSGCKDQTEIQKYTDYSFDYFDTVTTIVGFESSKKEFDKKCKQIKSKIEEYHKLYDIYNSYEGMNNLYTVNALTEGKHSVVKVDRKIIDLLKFCYDMYPFSFGKTNIAMGSVLKIWHNYRDEGKSVPSKELLQAANEHTNIEDVIINRAEGTVYLADDKLLLDVGAIAKGYAAERVVKWMISKDYGGYILNIGGNVCTVGERPDGKKWEVAIENPDNSDTSFIETLQLEGNMSLVTSGSYQRYYTVDGVDYHHIIDASTLMPAEFFKSVSVLCESSATADLLSTTLFCLNYDDGLSVLKNFIDVEVMWVKSDGTRLYTDGFKDYCKTQ